MDDHFGDGPVGCGTHRGGSLHFAAMKNRISDILVLLGLCILFTYKCVQTKIPNCLKTSKTMNLNSIFKIAINRFNWLWSDLGLSLDSRSADKDLKVVMLERGKT